MPRFVKMNLFREFFFLSLHTTEFIMPSAHAESHPYSFTVSTCLVHSQSPISSYFGAQRRPGLHDRGANEGGPEYFLEPVPAIAYRNNGRDCEVIC